LLEIRNFAEERDLDIVLGITEVGLDTRFGQAEFGPEAKAAIISLYRLDPSYYAQAENKNLFLGRVLKEGLHEIGHILGGEHCINNCLMKFSKTVADIDMKPIAFCEGCREKILKSS
jgi:archaemetzincin